MGHEREAVGWEYGKGTDHSTASKVYGGLEGTTAPCHLIERREESE
jgi:hypothetical protein